MKTFGHIIKITFFWKKVSIPIAAKALGLTIWLTNTGTHKIHNSTLKTFSIVQAIRSGKARLILIRRS